MEPALVAEGWFFCAQEHPSEAKARDLQSECAARLKPCPFKTTFFGIPIFMPLL
jgi:hypothetical protein